MSVVNQTIRRLINFTPLSRFNGPRYIELARLWAPTAAIYGAAAAVAGLYFTDWKVINDKIPFYRKKFAEDIYQ